MENSKTQIALDEIKILSELVKKTTILPSFQTMMILLNDFDFHQPQKILRVHFLMKECLKSFKNQLHELEVMVIKYSYLVTTYSNF